MKRLAGGGILGCLLLTLGATTTRAPSLEGRWRLVEQTYGEGRANLLRGQEPHYIEFTREDGRLAGRVAHGPPGSPLERWPALAGLDAAIVFSPEEDRVSARYRIRPDPADDTLVEIVEDYRVMEGGRELHGSVTISLKNAGAPAGAYVLQRRFEREP
jgi:hypothetical protein